MLQKPYQCPLFRMGDCRTGRQVGLMSIFFTEQDIESGRFVQLLDEFGVDAQRTISNIADSRCGRAFLDRIAKELLKQYSELFGVSPVLNQSFGNKLSGTVGNQGEVLEAEARQALQAMGQKNATTDWNAGSAVSGFRVGWNSCAGEVWTPNKRRAMDVASDACHWNRGGLGLAVEGRNIVPVGCGGDGVCCPSDADAADSRSSFKSRRAKDKTDRNDDDKRAAAGANACPSVDDVFAPEACFLGGTSQILGLESTAGAVGRGPEARAVLNGSIYFAEATADSPPIASSAVSDMALPSSTAQDATWLLPPTAWWSVDMDADGWTGDALLGPALLEEAGLWDAEAHPDVLAEIELPASTRGGGRA